MPHAAPPLQGIRPHAVIEALRARLHRQKNNQPPADGKTIALVVEGGSMRGVYSAGGMMALARLGYTDLFDRTYATSAGVMRDRAILALATENPHAPRPQPNIALVRPVESEIHAWTFDKREVLIAGAAHYEKIMHGIMTSV